MWSVLQAFFGGRGNPWRKTTGMRLTLEGGAELPHAGGAPDTDRYMLFASTLEGFPAGLRPFGDLVAPLRLAVLDNPRRSVLARLPLIFKGHIGEAVRRKGMHVHGGEQFDLDVADSFILDGEAFPAGSYRVFAGPRLHFVVP